MHTSLSVKFRPQNKNFLKQPPNSHTITLLTSTLSIYILIWPPWYHIILISGWWGSNPYQGMQMHWYFYLLVISYYLYATLSQSLASPRSFASSFSDASIFFTPDNSIHPCSHHCLKPETPSSAPPPCIIPEFIFFCTP